MITNRITSRIHLTDSVIVLQDMLVRQMGVRDEVDVYDDAGDITWLPSARPITAWPVYGVFAISALGMAVAVVFLAFIPSVIAYGTVLLVGCGLLFYRRWLAIAETRRAGGMGYIAVRGIERAGLIVLTVACLANGLVIALEMASWSWGS